MGPQRKIKVLIIDDSLLFREMLASRLRLDDSLEIVGTASDVFVAVEMIENCEPDVLTLDVEMPRMSGIEFLRRLMPQYPLPVVVVSSVSSSVFEALKVGAVDFVTKPAGDRHDGLASFVRELAVKIKIASTAKVSKYKQPSQHSHANASMRSSRRIDLIAIGASTGGTEAVSQILRELPAGMPPIVIVQHMPPVFTRLYAERLNSTCALTVREVEDGDRLQSGLVLLAAGDRQMSVKQQVGTGILQAFSRPGEKMSGHCPSVDHLFHSVSELRGLNVIGMILTGMGYDGAKGLLAMKKAGAQTLGQDEESSVVYGMPKVAFDIGAVQRQVPLGQMHEYLLAPERI